MFKQVLTMTGSNRSENFRVETLHFKHMIASFPSKTYLVAKGPKTKSYCIVLLRYNIVLRSQSRLIDLLPSQSVTPFIVPKL